MLLEFTVGNFLSFKDKTTFSLVADTSEKIGETHFFSVPLTGKKSVDLLKSSVIFGHNAAGKTNVLGAVFALKRLILTSSKMNSPDSYKFIKPFKLDGATLNQPSFFDIAFIAEEKRYRYSVSLTATVIHEEQLLFYSSQRPTVIFKRSELTDEEKSITNDNMLFLTKLDQNKDSHAQSVLKWFDQKLNVFFSNKDGEAVTLSHFDEFGDKISDFLKIADIGIEQLVTKDVAETELIALTKALQRDLSEERAKEVFEVLSQHKQKRFVSLHSQFQEDGSKKLVEFDFEETASEGTKTLVAVLGPLLYVMKHEEILFVDELTTELHPNLVKAIIKYINGKHNAKAQIIFTSHDTYLLDQSLFRRDQIWFAEKQKNHHTDLYSLGDFKSQSQSKDALEKKYLSGRYGAVPFINHGALTKGL